MIYYILKTLHIIIAIIFLTSLIGAYYFTKILNSKLTPSQIEKQASKISTFVISLALTAFILQPITGFIIIAKQHYSPMAHWILGTLLGYALLGAIWLSLIYQQQRCLMTLRQAIARQQPIPSFSRITPTLLLALSLVTLLAMYSFMALGPTT